MTERHGSPHWTAEEVQVLRDHYPRGGPAACLPLLPGRTRSGVKIKAAGMGLRHHCGELRAERDAAVRRLHAAGHNDMAVGRLLGISTTMARQDRVRLGLPALGLSAKGRQVLSAKQSRRYAEAQRAAETARREALRARRAVRRECGSVSANDFSGDQDEALAAVLAFRTRHKRPPTEVEFFRLMKSLGWRKCDGREDQRHPDAGAPGAPPPDRPAGAGSG